MEVRIWLVLLLVFIAGCQPVSVPTAQAEPESSSQAEVPEPGDNKLSESGPDESPAAEPSESNKPIAERFEAKVIHVVDGDTLDVLTDGKQTIRIRLHGVDTPERGQPYGKNATAALKTLLGQRVVVVNQGSGGFSRTAADIYQIGGRNSVNLLLVEAGWAWWARDYSDDPRLALAEDEARAARRGLWAAADGRVPVNPAKWRRLSKVERDKLR